MIGIYSTYSVHNPLSVFVLLKITKVNQRGFEVFEYRPEYVDSFQQPFVNSMVILRLGVAHF